MTADRLTIGDREHELIALVTLLQSKRLPLSHLAGLVEHVGSAVRLLENTFETQDDGQGVLGLVEPQHAEAIAKARREVESWDPSAYAVASVLDGAYPLALRSIFDRPPLLFTAGSLESTFQEKAIAIVGTRAATDNGKKRARRLAQAFAEGGFTIVSGLAAGIDTVAHQTALGMRSPTFAVVGTGLTRVYPPENAPLADAIVKAGGAIVSQFFPRSHGTKWSYPMRNVTMSGLSLATVVVEASETSGTRIQARVALKHGRAVYLLRSLVEAQPWARRLVEVGVDGILARILEDPRDVLDDVVGESVPHAFSFT